MIVAVCVDDRNGMLFHHRRQSQDRLQRADLMEVCGAHRLWMHPDSARLFSDAEGRIAVSDRFLELAGEEDYCFVESQSLEPWVERIQQLILYRWNRVYPADFHLTPLPEEMGFSLLCSTEFAGFSHPVITKEIYERR